MLTAWIPLVPITIDMGPLTFIDGSHRWHGNEWMTTFTDRDLDKLESKIQAAGNDVKKIPVLIESGCVSYHHGSTIHGSSANRGNRARIALTVHFQDGDNAYRPYIDCRGKEAVHVNDVVCRKRDDGSPDYADPDICPLLWQDPSKG
ncbi:ectoine hydroxylase-related dioxygenase (phytanoyl-CoA dioxygenase family) [Bradyrhizobium sp. i1.4.4]